MSRSSPAAPSLIHAPGSGSHRDASHDGPIVHAAKLDNGMDVVVIPDTRVPVATHMVWYRNGSADDPIGVSGIAHFLEHLMFKGTEKNPAGLFSKVVSELGGQENAFTSFDYTAYYQRVAKEHLGTMMGFEADRMANLRLSDEVVAPERDVVLEERRMRVETDPAAQLSEAMAASLFVHHPYGIPIIGWMHEIEGLDRGHALDYYGRFYTPENAILVVAGDVTLDDVRRHADATYGRIAPRGDRPARLRPREPEPRAMRRVAVADPRVEQPMLQRLYLSPSVMTQTGRESVALEVLSELLGGGATSYLYRTLVLEKGVAVNAGSWYMAAAIDDTRFSIYLVPAQGVTLDAAEEALDAALARLADDALTDAAITRAKTRLVAETVYAADSQTALARVYGSALAIGESIEDVQRWPVDVEAVTKDDLVAAAARVLVPQRSVTGQLKKAG